MSSTARLGETAIIFDMRVDLTSRKDLQVVSKHIDN